MQNNTTRDLCFEVDGQSVRRQAVEGARRVENRVA